MISFREIISQIYPDEAERISTILLEGVLTEAMIHDYPVVDWYKKFNLFVTYADTFYSQGQADLGVLTNKLGYLRDLGCTAVHILPPFQSPLIDGGFDISDYYTIRADLGGNEAFYRLIQTAHSMQIHLFIDLVCNHVSQEHEWFKKALLGESQYRELFIHSQSKPVFIKKHTNSEGVWASYEVEEGVKDFRIIFPDQAGDIPHWIQAADNNWYYHTFYPHQIDLDWNNPEVFIEFGKILKFWSKLGLNFRLDAIPFVGKDVHKGITESTDKTHLIIQALHKLMKQVSPESVFLVESCQPLEITKRYFGTVQTPESELAYNFHLMNALWSALVTQDSFHLWTAIKATKNLPQQGQWITFLRNHDDLSLELPEEEIRLLLYNALKDKGLVCKEGFGIGGQTVEFLDNDPKKLVMAYLLLASLPGCLAIICGDEIGKPNDYEYMKEQTRQKQAKFKNQVIVDDVRDINRGYTSDEEINQPKSQEVYRQLSMILKTRLKYSEIATKWPTYEPCRTAATFSCRYSLNDGDMVVWINLSNISTSLPFILDGEVALAINGASYNNGEVQLPAYAGIWFAQNRIEK